MICSIGWGLLLACLASACYNFKEKKEFVESLSEAQAKTFRGLSRHRALIYAASMAAGAVAAAGAASTGMLAPGCGEAAGLCAMGGVMMSVAYACYTLSPKKDLMINHLTSQRQARLWGAMYRKMVVVFHLSFVFGVAGSLALAKGNGLCGKARGPTRAGREKEQSGGWGAGVPDLDGYLDPDRDLGAGGEHGRRSRHRRDRY